MQNQNRHRNMYEDPLSVLLPWYQLVIFLMLFPSNSVLVFLRKNEGYRLMRPWVFWINALVLFFLSVMGGQATAAAQSPTFGGEGGNLGMKAALAAAPGCIFAVAMVALAYIHRGRGWDLALRPVDPVHTMARGDSHLVGPLGRLKPLTMPVFSFSTWKFHDQQVLPIPEWQIQRYVEPILVFALSGIALFAFHWTLLGGWLFISAICLAGVEALTVENAINLMLDGRDDGIEARFMKATDDAITNQGKPDPNRKVGGLVTASPEMERLRAARLETAPPPARVVLPGHAPRPSEVLLVR